MRLDRNQFRAWLKERPGDEIVGKNRDCHACPIATFYYDRTGGGSITISSSMDGGYKIDRGYGDRDLPWWAAQFVFAVDGDANNQISAARALEILDQGR